MLALFPVLIAILGLLLWFVAANQKVSELGRILFFCGVLVITWVLSRHVVHIG